MHIILKDDFLVATLANAPMKELYQLAHKTEGDVPQGTSSFFFLCAPLFVALACVDSQSDIQ